MTIKKLAIAVTFHYEESRLQYLEKIASQFSLLADSVLVHIFTNTSDSNKKSLIDNAVNKDLSLIHI